MDLTHAMLIAALGWFLGGFVNGVAGFGAALVAMPIAALNNDMALAVSSCALVVFALNIQMTWSYRRYLKYTGIGPLSAGGIPGAVCGVLLLRHAPESALKCGLGFLLILYSLWGLWAAPAGDRNPGPFWAVLTGFLSTSLGTAFGVNGPPLAVYLSLRGGSQQAIKAALGAFFLVSGALIIISHCVAGLHTFRTFVLFVFALPAVMLGCWAGMRVSGNLSDRSFRRSLFLMLLFMGFHMIWTALKT